MPVNGLSASQLANFRTEAQRLVNKYDRSGDNAISLGETNQRLSMGADSYSFSTRVSSNYSERTTVMQESFSQLSAGEIAAADLDHDGRVTADELVESYLQRKDTNHDGNLSFWEKLSTSVGGMRDMFESQTTVETGRRTNLEFDPEYVAPSNPYRPVPPSVNVNPYSPGPTPPSPSYRPAPPPVYAPSSRPTPPSPSSGGRPTPPHI